MNANRKSIGSDLAKVDAHQNTAADYDDIPEVTAADLARADLQVGGVTVRRGRPPALTRRHAISIRLDAEVVAFFKQGGAGWQTRINEALLWIMKSKKRYAGTTLVATRKRTVKGTALTSTFGKKRA